MQPPKGVENAHFMYIHVWFVPSLVATYGWSVSSEMASHQSPRLQRVWFPGFEQRCVEQWSCQENYLKRFPFLAGIVLIELCMCIVLLYVRTYINYTYTCIIICIHLFTLQVRHEWMLFTIVSDSSNHRWRNQVQTTLPCDKFSLCGHSGSQDWYGFELLVCTDIIITRVPQNLLATIFWLMRAKIWYISFVDK